MKIEATADEVCSEMPHDCGKSTPGAAKTYGGGSRHAKKPAGGVRHPPNMNS
jgi:hypothetical protein